MTVHGENVGEMMFSVPDILYYVVCLFELFCEVAVTFLIQKELGHLQTTKRTCSLSPCFFSGPEFECSIWVLFWYFNSLKIINKFQKFTHLKQCKIMVQTGSVFKISLMSFEIIPFFHSFRKFSLFIIIIFFF